MPKIRASKFDFHADVLKPETFSNTLNFTGTLASGTERASVDPYAGTTAANGKPIWTLDQIIAQLNRTGANWVGDVDPAPQRGDNGSHTLTYGFFENQNELVDNGYVYETGGSYYGLAEYFNFAVLHR